MNTINPSVPNNLYTPKSQPPKQVQEGKQEVRVTEAQPEIATRPQAKGVLRLLETGHFEGKGVAEVRLRINFYDQVQALDKAKAQQASQQAVNELGDFVTSAIAEYSEIPDRVLQELQVFQAALAAIDTDEADGASIGSTVNAVFANLAASLGVSLDSNVRQDSGQAPADETSTDSLTPVSDDTKSVAAPAEEGLGFDAQALISTVEEGVNNFESSLASATEAPEFVRPEGNGKAFDKFLAIYESLSAGETQQNTDVFTITVDQTA